MPTPGNPPGVQALLALFEAGQALHRPTWNAGHDIYRCPECSADWPCLTATTLHAQGEVKLEVLASRFRRTHSMCLALTRCGCGTEIGSVQLTHDAAAVAVEFEHKRHIEAVLNGTWEPEEIADDHV